MDAINTAQPDEFARLLAELNGTAAENPAPTPAAAAAIAPAFGLAIPYPALVTTVAEAEPVASTPPPAALRAPELIGADELAAAPPLTASPPLVAPSAQPPVPAVDPVALSSFGAPSSAGPPLEAAADPELPLAAPLFGETAFEAPSLAAPSFPPPSLTGPTFAPPSSLPPGDLAGRPSTSAGPLPLGDFAALLTTPIDADEAPSPPAAPLMFGSGPVDDDEPDLGRATVGEWVGLALSVVLAPIGLIVGIVLAVRSVRRRGWVVGVVRSTIAIGTVLTVVLGIGGYFGYLQLKQQQAHDEIAAASAAFCSTLKANPGMAELPTFGWPAVAASIPDSLKAMQAYEVRWTKLARVSPAGIKPDVAKVAAAAKQIIGSVTVSRTVDDASNIEVMSSVASASGVPAWQSEYCG